MIHKPLPSSLRLSAPFARWGRPLVAASLWLASGAVVLAQTSVRDPSLPASDLLRPNPDFITSTVLPLADGNILVTGQLKPYTQCDLIRLKSDGTLDPSFHKPGIASAPSGSFPFVKHAAVQKDGKIVISGNFASVDGATRNGIARLNADGTLDAGFDPGKDPEISAAQDSQKIIVQPDGKIIIGITRFDMTTFRYKTPMRFNADGSTDKSFDPPARFGTEVDFALQQDGKILCLGLNYVPDRGYDGTVPVARLNSDGSFDSDYQPPLNTGDEGNPYLLGNYAQGDVFFHTIELDKDGNALIGGSILSTDAEVDDRDPGIVAKLGTNGALDTNFKPRIIGRVYDILTQKNGQVFVGGYLRTINDLPRHGLARFNADGTLDGFDASAVYESELADALALALQPDGRLLAFGYQARNQAPEDFALARFFTGDSDGGGTNPPPPTGKQPALSAEVQGLKLKLNKTGTKYTVKGKLSLTNDGDKAAKNLQAGAYLSADATFDAADQPLGKVALANFGLKKVGKGKSSKPVALKIKGAAGELGDSTSGKYLLLVVDPDGLVPEADKSNNVVAVGPLP